MKVKRYRYRISVWDHEDCDWTLKACGVLRFHLRKRVDELMAQGYDREASILIERDASMALESDEDRRYWRPRQRAAETKQQGNLFKE